MTILTTEMIPQYSCWDSLSDSSCMCIPIRAPEEIFGVFHLCLDRQEAEYADDAWEDSLESKHILATRISGQYALFLMNLRLRETLRIEAIRDPLTSLYNRRHMEAVLEREAFRAARYSSYVGIIMLDIDHFKQVNDTYGHEAGDMVLQELGKFLLSNTRGEDMACRYGGEEFLLIMSEASLHMTQKRARELWSKIRELHLEYQGRVLPLTISIGVASLPDHGSAVKDVLKAADTALYQAKAEGRDRVIVAPVPVPGGKEKHGQYAM